MYFNQDYSDRILRKVEDLASRVHLLKERLAKQKISVKLEHYWELAHVHRSFAEFKWRVEQLDEDGDSQCNRDYEHMEATWNELVLAVDALLAALRCHVGEVRPGAEVVELTCGSRNLQPTIEPTT